MAKKLSMAGFLKKAQGKGLEHYLKCLESSGTIPIQKTANELGEALEIGDASRVVLFFRNEHNEPGMYTDHVYHLVQLGSTKESAKRLGTLYLILKPEYPIWLPRATFNHKAILNVVYDDIAGNLKKEDMYEDWSIKYLLDKLQKWESWIK
ncbi:MAG: hypothetical protein V1839_00565 [archaeon]